MSLFEQIGGRDAVDAAVDLFYRKVLKDQELSPFFEDTDMDTQAAKQKAFLTFAFGGPNNYTGKDLREGHKHLLSKGLDDKHVDKVIALLGETLQELKVAPELIQEAAKIAESVRGDVLNR